MLKPTKKFITACEEARWIPDRLPIDQFGRYLEYLLSTNEHCNLTAIRDPSEAWMRHVYDSLTLLPHLSDTRGVWVDVGTGGGVPGMVLALVYPDQPIHLIEATGKKCRFLSDTVNELGIGNVTVHHVRAEEAGRDPAFREGYTIALSRAVSALNILVELSLPLLEVEGWMLAMKGEGYQAEMDQAERAIHALGGREPTVHQQEHNNGAIIALQKTSSTPEKYPRKPGMPNKRPLI